nr:serine/threonine-protein kinase-like protein ACR4 [Tanacetum cinerariifolium]
NKKKKINSNETVHDQNSDQESPSIKLCASPYTLVDIDVATDGFSERRIIGKGRLGTVYAAVLAGEKCIERKKSQADQMRNTQTN